MANQSENAEKFIEDVTKLLNENKFSAAVKIFNADHNKKYLRGNSWDLIPVLCKNVTREAREKAKNRADCSEELLKKLASEANPDEGILEYLEQMDEADPELFRISLDCLSIIIDRDTSQKIKSLEWTLNSIRACLEQHSKEEKLQELDVQAEEEEDLLTSEESADVVLIFNYILNFYEHFISECHQNSCVGNRELEQLLSSRLLQMFDILFPYVDMKKFTELKSVLSRMQTLILQLILNPMSLLKYVFYRSLNVMKPKSKSISNLMPETLEEIKNSSSVELTSGHSSELINPFEDVIIVSDLAYGMFFYSLLSETENESIKMPMVYNPKYIMLSLIHVTIPFFEKKTNTAVNNGLNLLNLLLDQLNELLERSDLYFSSHKSILINLNNTMIYSPNEENRKLALVCFKKYIQSFNWEARYYLLLKYRSHVTHPGTLGFLVVQIKDFVSKFLEFPQNSATFHKYGKYYRGKLLFDLIKQYCFLTNGSKTDLVENADHIISSLNAIQYLVVRDKKNVTDIKRFIKKIKSDFLSPLSEGVKSWRDYYEMKLKEIGNENGNRSGTASQTSLKSEVEFELCIKNQALPKLTAEQQKMAYESCLNAVDLIDLLLKRLTECFLGVLRVRSFSQVSQNQGPNSEKKKNSSEDQHYDSNIREKILKASLQFVPTHGWSKEAITNGAESLGYPGITSGIFPNGGADLISFFYVQCNQKLKEHMIEVTSKPDYTSEPKEFIRSSIEVRLRMLIPFIGKWPQAIAIMSMPPNVPVALANLLALSDDICFYAGDKSVDFNWYIRRLGVSGIYKVTELYMIQDKSTEYVETWSFLDRRLTEAVQVQQIISNGSEATSVAKDVVSAVFTTARNILHLNDPR